MFRPLLLVLLVCTCVRAQKMLPAEAVPGMVDSVHQRIVALHPFAFETDGVTALEEARTQVQKEVEKAMQGEDSLSLLDFKRLASPLQEVTGCGHLILEPFYDSLTYVGVRKNRFPLSLIKVADGSHRLAKGLQTDTDSLPPGTQITALNGQPVAELIESMSYFSGLNDQGNRDATKAALATAISTFYQSYFGRQDSLRITSAENGIHTIYPEQKKYSNPKKQAQDINDWLKFRLSEDGETGILRIRKFSAYEFHNGNYYRFIRSVFDSLNTAGIDQLVIDIRGNTGGSSRRIRYLYSFLAGERFQFSSDARLTGPAKASPLDDKRTSQWRQTGVATKRDRKIQRGLTYFHKPQKAKNRYTGRVVVLIDQMSFSASGMFARYIQGSERGKLVGLKAGAAAGTTFGGNRNASHFYLGPDKAFELRVNTISLQLPYPMEGNVTPDVVVPVTAAGLLAGEDEQLEEALRVVKNGAP